MNYLVTCSTTTSRCTKLFTNIPNIEALTARLFDELGNNVCVEYVYAEPAIGDNSSSTQSNSIKITDMSQMDSLVETLQKEGFKFESRFNSGNREYIFQNQKCNIKISQGLMPRYIHLVVARGSANKTPNMLSDVLLIDNVYELSLAKIYSMIWDAVKF